MKYQELEVKFFVQDLARLEQRLVNQGAVLVQPRTLEVNLRFDTPENELANNFQVLRLRQDTAARLTFKGPAYAEGGVRVRREIEFVVDDFDAARAFLEALGYQVSILYEKWRSIYALGPVLVTLDELPYGSFLEIEGPDSDSIHSASLELNLKWEARVPGSYISIFQQLKDELGLKFRDLSFDNFAGLPVSNAQLNLPLADI